MNKFLKKSLAVSSMLFVITLASCSKKEDTDKVYESFNALAAETNADITKELDIVNKDGVYGNIYLPLKAGDKTVTWWSSNDSIVNSKKVSTVAAGEVNRPNVDTKVKLIAKIGDGDSATKYEQEVTVKAAPEELEDSDFQAYLFTHFVGESYGEGPQSLEGHPTGEQLFFALADVGEGLHFKDMNGSKMGDLKPVLKSNVGELGVRDPYICRSPEGDTFYLIATDLSVYTRGGWGRNNGADKFTISGSHAITLWESHDLVNWTEGRLINVAREDAGMAWAPEMIYSEETGEYLIFFSSTILNEEKNAIKERDCIYYTTTRDFVHFGETKKFIKNQPYPEGQEDPQKSSDSPQAINNNERKIIDASVMKIDDYYYCAAKDGDNHEQNGGILIQKTTDLFDIDSWEKVLDLDDVGFKAENRDANNTCLEGPEWFLLNEADRKDPSVPEIGLMADFYANTSIGYIPWTTTNIEDATNAKDSWRRLESGTGEGKFSWDSQTKRHGSILRITAEEAALLKENFPIAQ